MTALYSVLLKLKSENEACISPTQGHHAYALFLNLIRQSNPELSEKLHRSTQAKPFTLSSLQGKFKHADKSLQMLPDADYSIRLTFLNEETFCHFMDAVYQNENKPLRLESAVFSVQQLLVNPQDSPWSRCQSFEELIDKAALENKIQLDFASVTTFRSGGKRNIIFPEPSVLFSSLLAKWQELSPLKFEANFSESFGQIALTSYKLETHILHFNGYQETGFEGKCAFTLGKDLTDAAIKSLNTLADFTFYCGTGAKTTMGMGQTRRIYGKLV
ncbi:MAG: CRISPR-associated endoribonuclease Cas6 [Dehalococcoidales bacterium]|nr:CRISPR-associated endoribonuclease Cas6 [Dehalococcoidales bacterium]